MPLNLVLAKSSLLFFIRNALSLSMLTAIRSNLLHNVDCDLRVIILSANGGVFSSGHDLKELVRQLVQGKYKIWTPGPWTTSMDRVHGPLSLTGSMDPLFLLPLKLLIRSKIK